MHDFNPNGPPEDVAVILSFLRPYLPKCLPLYRRIQFGHYTQSARIITSIPLATMAATTSQPQQIASAQDPWLVAFSDPDRGPETQIFLYGSWENAPPRSPESDPTITALVISFSKHIHHSSLYQPSSLSSEAKIRIAAALPPPLRPASEPTEEEADALLAGRHHALIGSVHRSTALILLKLGLLDPSFVDGPRSPEGLPATYNKWIFDLRPPSRPSASSRFAKDHDGRRALHGADLGEGGRQGSGQGTGQADLPDGLRWGEVRQRDYALVRSRTGIPRQDRTLRMLPSVAIFPSPEVSSGLEEGAVQRGADAVQPVAWTFLGVDSSLTTLHVEPEYRGMGLAKLLARRAWSEHLDVYTTKYVEGGAGTEDRWAHADVAVDNEASNGVCGSLGGRVEWQDYWFRADLDKIL